MTAIPPKTGAVVESRAASWDSGNAPAWFGAGLSSPPPAKSNQPGPGRIESATEVAMRKLLGAVLVALLIPAALAAQKPSTSGEEVGRKVPVFTVTKDAAIKTAVTRVRSDLVAGKLNSWGDGSGGGIRPASVAVAGASLNPTGGKNGTPVYVVTLTAPNAKGRLRVTVDARTGLVAGTPVMDVCKPC